MSSELSRNETQYLTDYEGDGDFFSFDSYILDFMEKMHSLHYVLEQDLQSCDAKWSLFVAAALSSQYESQLRPFPPRYVTEQDGNNIETLLGVINEMPKLNTVIQAIAGSSYDTLNMKTFDLLHWVLLEVRKPMLRELDVDEYDQLMRFMSQTDRTPSPTNVFEVCDLVENSSESSINFLNRQYPLRLAFYGGTLESFYSTLAQGFVQYKCSANNFLAKPLKLTTDITVALSHSTTDSGWSESECGATIRCLAVVEVIHNPELVSCQPNELISACADIVIHDSDLVKIRYLIFYGKDFPVDAEAVEEHTGSGTIWERYRFPMSLTVYMIALVSLGCLQGSRIRFWRDWATEKGLFLFSCWKRLFIPPSEF